MTGTFTFPLLAARVVDGDTIAVTVDQGMHNRWVGELRVQHVDAPEVHSKDALEKSAGLSVASFVQRWLAAQPQGAYDVYSTALDDKFGRLLGDVTRTTIGADGTPKLIEGLAGALLKLGCRHYDGEKKQPWTPVELNAILAAAGGEGRP
jgi:endonuclease YncB( thermonuclease family)